MDQLSKSAALVRRARTISEELNTGYTVSFQTPDDETTYTKLKYNMATISPSIQLPGMGQQATLTLDAPTMRMVTKYLDTLLIEYDKTPVNPEPDGD